MFTAEPEMPTSPLIESDLNKSESLDLINESLPKNDLFENFTES